MPGRCAETACAFLGDRLCCWECMEAATAHLVKPSSGEATGEATRQQWTAYYDERDRLQATQMRCARHDDQHDRDVHGKPGTALSPENFDRLEAARQEWSAITTARARSEDPGSHLYDAMVQAHARYLRLRDELEPGWRAMEARP